MDGLSVLDVVIFSIHYNCHQIMQKSQIHFKALQCDISPNSLYIVLIMFVQMEQASSFSFKCASRSPAPSSHKPQAKLLFLCSVFFFYLSFHICLICHFLSPIPQPKRVQNEESGEQREGRVVSFHNEP